MANPLRLGIFITICSALFASGYARGEEPVFSEANQRLMSVAFDDGLSLSEGMPMYPVGQRWLLPLGELSAAIGIQIATMPAIGLAEGFVIDENRRFSLNLKECKVEHDGKVESFACEDAVVADDDIYVYSDVLEKWLPLKLELNSFRSEAVVHGTEKFPAQMRKERERKSGLGQSGVGLYDPGYPRIDIPAENADGAMIDQQVGYLVDRAGTTEHRTFHHDTAIAGELLGMEASAFASGTGSVFDRQRYLLAKRSPEGGLFGALNARDLQLLDVTLPPLPLIGGGRIVRGALISSFPLQDSTLFGTRDFRGDIAAGWEVELYQNDVLIDRLISKDGLYEFKNVPLLFGVNRFRLAFYGPQGQRRESFETYAIDRSFMPPGAQSYRVGLGDPGDGKRLGDMQVLAQFDKSLRPNFTILSALSRATPPKETQAYTYGLLGARAFLKNVLLTSTASTADDGGYAFENGFLAPVFGATAGASYINMSRFRSELFPSDHGHLAREAVKGNLAANLMFFPPVRVTIEGTRTTYEDGSANLAFTQRTSLRTGPVYWFNNFIYDELAAARTGELSALAQILGTEVRSTLSYDQRQATAASIDLQKILSDRLSVAVGWQESFQDRVRRVFGSLNRQFEKFTFSANASVETRGDFSVRALLSYSFGREPRAGEWTTRAKPQAATGSVSVFVFLDLNQNGVLDPGERPLKGAELTINQQDAGIATDDRGYALVTGLTPHVPNDVSIAIRSLEDPLYRPSPKGARFYPRPGKTARIDLPVIVSSELTGFVRISKDGATKPKRAMNVELVGVDGTVAAKTVTEADGYYLIEDVKPGNYVLRIDPAQLDAQKVNEEPKSFDIHVGPEGLLDSVYDFRLVPR